MSDANDDRELAIRLAFDRGDFDDSATLMLELYSGEILGFLIARSKSASDADEVFAMFAEDLWKGLPGFGWRCSARGWAYTLARNAANRWATSPHNRPGRHETLSRHAQVSKLIDRARTATRPYLRTDVKDEMRALREELPPDDQTLLILRVDRKLSWEELAIVMCDETDAADAAGRARDASRLRKRFERIKDRLRARAREEGLLD